MEKHECLSSFLFILSDPVVSRMEDYIKRGELEAYPTLEFIKNRLDIENEISEGYLSWKGKNLLINNLVHIQNISGDNHAQSEEEDRIFRSNTANTDRYEDDILPLIDLSDDGIQINILYSIKRLLHRFMNFIYLIFYISSEFYFLFLLGILLYLLLLKIIFLFQLQILLFHYFNHLILKSIQIFGLR